MFCLLLPKQSTEGAPWVRKSKFEIDEKEKKE